MPKKQAPQPKTVPVSEDNKEPEKPFIRGRTFRAYVGFGIIVLVAAVFARDHFFLNRSFEALEVMGQALLIGVGLLLIDKKLYKEFKEGVAKRLGKK